MISWAGYSVNEIMESLMRHRHALGIGDNEDKIRRIAMRIYNKKNRKPTKMTNEPFIEEKTVKPKYDLETLKAFATAYLSELGFPTDEHGNGLPYLERWEDAVGNLIDPAVGRRGGGSKVSDKLPVGGSERLLVSPAYGKYEPKRARRIIDRMDQTHEDAVANWKEVLQMLEMLKGAGLSDKEAYGAIIDSDYAEKVPYRILELMKDEAFYKSMYAALRPIILRTRRGETVRLTPFLKSRIA
jgi:hypothetical protein